MCMYEVNEHWKQYRKEKELQAKIAKEFKLNEAMLEEMELEICNEKTSFREMDEFLAELRKKNGQTEY